MTMASLIEVGTKENHKDLLVVFSNCNAFDAMMFKNNVFDWLFTNTLDHFELSDDSKSGFMVRFVENRDVKKFTNFFPNISFETTVKV